MTESDVPQNYVRPLGKPGAADLGCTRRVLRVIFSDRLYTAKNPSKPPPSSLKGKIEA